MSTHTFQRANPPALVITLALEQPITVNLVAASEGQQQRISTGSTRGVSSRSSSTSRLTSHESGEPHERLFETAACFPPSRCARDRNTNSSWKCERIAERPRAMTNSGQRGHGGARPGAGRPRLTLRQLVEGRRFDSRNRGTVARCSRMSCRPICHLTSCGSRSRTVRGLAWAVRRLRRGSRAPLRWSLRILRRKRVESVMWRLCEGRRSVCGSCRIGAGRSGERNVDC